MPFLEKIYHLQHPQKAFLWLMRTLNCSQQEAQKILDKQRLTQNNFPIHKSQEIFGEVKLKHFFPSPILLPKILQTPYFVIYNKPHKLLTHPKGTYPHLSLCDALKYEFGACSNPVHRLDFETAGLLLCSIHKRYEAPLKLLFENNKIKKTYLARVRGRITQAQEITAPILTPPKGEKSQNLSIRSRISPLGKPSYTRIRPISHDAHTTLLEIEPLTGRTHQIRLHLSSIGHPILGDPLYGCPDLYAQRYLEGTLKDTQREELFGAPFLHLWAFSLEFEFLEQSYKTSLTIQEINLEKPSHSPQYV